MTSTVLVLDSSLNCQQNMQHTDNKFNRAIIIIIDLASARVKPLIIILYNAKTSFSFIAFQLRPKVTSTQSSLLGFYQSI